VTDRQNIFFDLQAAADELRAMGTPVDLAAIVEALEPEAVPDCE
jgi:hypothetical protein